MYEQPYTSWSWRARSVALIIVVLLHFSLIFVSTKVDKRAPIEPSRIVQILEAPLEHDEPILERFAVPVLVAPPLPQVTVPDIAIEEAQVAVMNGHRSPAAAFPAAVITGNAQESPGSDVGRGSRTTGELGGEGEGSGGSMWTNCTHRVMPGYPARAKPSRAKGRVTLLVELDESGRIVGVQVAQSSGSRDLDAAGVAAIKKWKCSPVMENGRAVRTLAKQEFTFELK